MKWTKKEINILKNNQDKTINELQELLINHSKNAIQQKINSYNFDYKRINSIWTQEELLFIYKNRFKKTIPELQEKINRSKRSIRSMLTKIYQENDKIMERINGKIIKYYGFKEKHTFSDEEILYINNNYKILSIFQMAKDLNVSYWTLKNQLSEMNLPFYNSSHNKVKGHKGNKLIVEKINEKREEVFNKEVNNKNIDINEISSSSACKINYCKPTYLIIDDIINELEDNLNKKMDNDLIKKIFVDLQIRNNKNNLSINPKSLISLSIFLGSDINIEYFNNNSNICRSVTIRDLLKRFFLSKKYTGTYRYYDIRDWYINNKIYERFKK